MNNVSTPFSSGKLSLSETSKDSSDSSWLTHMRMQRMVLDVRGQKVWWYFPRGCDQIWIVWFCALSGSVEQSWAQRSIASSIIHQSHKWYRLSREWQGCRACRLWLSASALPLSEWAISLWKQSTGRLVSIQENQRYRCFRKVHGSI